MGETNIFKVLADSQRRDILIMLRNERLNAGEIAEKLQITINTTVFDELIIWVNQFGGKKV